MRGEYDGDTQDALVNKGSPPLAQGVPKKSLNLSDPFFYLSIFPLTWRVTFYFIVVLNELFFFFLAFGIAPPVSR